MFSLHFLLILGLRVCLIQLKISENLHENFKNLEQQVAIAVETFCPRVIALPECFTTPYETSVFPKLAEEIPNGETSKYLSKLSSRHGIYLIGGSFIERDGDHLYNTATVWGPNGDLVTRHRKVSPLLKLNTA